MSIDDTENSIFSLKRSSFILIFLIFLLFLCVPPAFALDCGKPSYSRKSDQALFVWKNCLSNEIFMRATAGGDSAANGFFFDGEVVNAQGFSAVTGFSLEGSDVLDYTTNPTRIDFLLKVWNKGEDGFQFAPVTEAGTCIELHTPPGMPVLVGPAKQQISGAFDLSTLGACADAPVSIRINDVTVSEANAMAQFTLSLSASSTDPITVSYATQADTASEGMDYSGVAVPFTVTFAPGITSIPVDIAILQDVEAEGNEHFTIELSNPLNATILDGSGRAIILDDEVNACGAPSYNASTDQALFVWKDCQTGAWTVRNTAGGDTAGAFFEGQVMSSQGFAAVTGEGLESIDTLDYTTDPTIIDYVLKVWNSGEDGFQFTPVVEAGTCVELFAPLGVPVLVGPGRQQIVSPFDLGTFSACQGPLDQIVISDIVVSEAETSASFIVSLSVATTQTVTVDYITQSGTAIDDIDYTAVSTPVTLIFAPNVTSMPVTIALLQDTLIEGSEVFTVELSAPNNASILDGSGTATIIDDEILPEISIDDVTVNEADSSVSFAVSLSTGIDQTVTVDYVTQSGTAIDDMDYMAVDTPTTLTFAPNEISIPVTIALLQDALIEGSEVFTVELSAPNNASILDGSGIATITDDEIAPEISIDDVIVNEAEASVSFTVSLSAATTQTVTVDYMTQSGTAVDDVDFTAISLPTTLTFAPNVTNMPVTIALLQDTIFEGDEVFTLELSAPDNATILDASGTATIVDDDIAPQIRIDDVMVNEADAGASFTVSLSTATTQTVTVDYITQSGTAIDDVDFTAISIPVTLTFAPNETSIAVTIALLQDILFEDSETFTVELSASNNASILDGSGMATIIDDEIVPEIRIDDVTVNEAEASANFTVSLSTTTAQTVTVDYITQPDTAIGDQDYTAVSTPATLTFEPDVTSMTVTIALLQDTLIEGSEAFTVELNASNNATILDGSGTATIIDDEITPEIRIDDVTVNEADSSASFTVSLSVGVDQIITVDYVTQSDTATADLDYVAVSIPATLTFAPNVTSMPITIAILQDAIFEGSEAFTVELGAATNAMVIDTTGAGIITDDDTNICGAPSYNASIDQALFVWKDCQTGAWTVRNTAGGDTAGAFFEGQVMSSQGFSAVTGEGLENSDTLDYTTDPTIIDFVLKVWNSGEDGFQFTPVVEAGTCIELSAPLGMPVLLGPDRQQMVGPFDLGTFGACQALLQIVVLDITVSEADAEAVFTVGLTAPGDLPVSVNVATADGSATAGTDYQSISTTLTFAPGQVEKTVTVQIFQDDVFEGRESFFLELSQPVNAFTGTSSSQAIIIDDEINPRRNILFIAVDDLRPDIGTNGFSYAGTQNNKPVLTPNIDNLAKSGIQFSSAYSQVAVCSASRNSVMSGLRPEQIRRWDNYNQLHWSLNYEDKATANNYAMAAPDSHVPLAKHLQNNGYYTLSVGKVYHRPNTAYATVQGWDKLVTTGNRGTASPVIRCKASNSSLHAPGANNRCPQGQSKVTSLTHAFDYDPANPNNQSADQLAANSAIDFLNQFKSGQLGNKENFFFAVGFKKPHAPFITTTEKLDQYSINDIKVPASQPPQLAASIGLSLWGEIQQYFYSTPMATLTQAITGSKTTVAVSDTTEFYVGQQIAIYDGAPQGTFNHKEYALVTAKNTSASTLTLQRGYETTARSHSKGSIVANHKLVIKYGVNDPKKVLATARNLIIDQDVAWLPNLHSTIAQNLLPSVKYGTVDYAINPLQNSYAIKDLRRHYWASTSMVDDEIGKLIRYIENDPELSQNTIIVLWSDHGYYLGEYGDWAKHTNGELATHVPLIVSTPETRSLENMIDGSGGDNRKSMRSQLVELVDLYPTIVDLTGVPLPVDNTHSAYLKGLSFAPLLEDGQEQRAWKDYAFSQYDVKATTRDSNRQVRGTSVRSDKWRFTEWRQLGAGIDQNGNPTRKINTGRSVIGIEGSNDLINANNPSAALVVEELYYEDEIVAYRNDPDIAPTPKNYAHAVFSNTVPDNYPAGAPTIQEVIAEHRLKLKYAGNAGCTVSDLTCSN